MVITSLSADITVSMGTEGKSSSFSLRYSPIMRNAYAVLMFVYIDTASAVKRQAWEVEGHKFFFKSSATADTGGLFSCHML